MPPSTSGWAKLAAEAREVRDPARELQLIREDLGDCRRCGLSRDRTHLVFGSGDPAADLVLVSGGPGYAEDQQGEPLLGDAGEMLDKMLSNVLGLTRAEVYLLDIVKCRPARDRAPQLPEIAACRPFLERQIEAIAPKVIVVLGEGAFTALFGANTSVPRPRGQWQTYRGFATLPTLHPAWLLKAPADKRLAFEDLKSVRQRYDELGGKRPAFRLG